MKWHTSVDLLAHAWVPNLNIGSFFSSTCFLHHHHASLLKIINKTGSLFRGLGALRLFSLSLSLSLALVLCSLRALHCHRS